MSNNTVRNNIGAACYYHDKTKIPPGEIAAVLLDTPESLGNTYEEVIASLKMLARAGMYLGFKPVIKPRI